jgi:hypothetical protein
MHNAPPAMRTILTGRRRVEVSADEAAAVLRWARGLDGWDPDALPPGWIYPVTPVDP